MFHYLNIIHQRKTPTVVFPYLSTRRAYGTTAGGADRHTGVIFRRQPFLVLQRVESQYRVSVSKSMRGVADFENTDYFSKVRSDGNTATFHYSE